MHSDVEIENLDLEYRYGYRFVDHDRLSWKNVLGVFKGDPKKLSIWEHPKTIFSIISSELEKTEKI
jgi:hypothetical protein